MNHQNVQNFINQLHTLNQLTQVVNNDIAKMKYPANIKSAYDLPYPTYKAGTVLWGFAYKFTSTKENMRLSQTPVKGMLLCHADRKHYEEFLTNPNDYKFHFKPAYFVPFSQKTPDKLLFSKAVSIYGRRYAETENDAWDGYCHDMLTSLNQANEHVQDILDTFLEMNNATPCDTDKPLIDTPYIIRERNVDGYDTNVDITIKLSRALSDDEMAELKQAFIDHRQTDIDNDTCFDTDTLIEETLSEFCNKHNLLYEYTAIPVIDF